MPYWWLAQLSTVLVSEVALFVFYSEAELQRHLATVLEFVPFSMESIER